MIPSSAEEDQKLKAWVSWYHRFNTGDDKDRRAEAARELTDNKLIWAITGYHKTGVAFGELLLEYPVTYEAIMKEAKTRPHVMVALKLLGYV